MTKLLTHVAAPIDNEFLNVQNSIYWPPPGSAWIAKTDVTKFRSESADANGEVDRFNYKNAMSKTGTTALPKFLDVNTVIIQP